jgi:hypothetical protein
MEVMGCLPLTVPTLDPRSYRMGPRHGKKRRNQSKELSPVRGRWEHEVYGASRFDEDLIVFLTLPAYRLLD